MSRARVLPTLIVFDVDGTLVDSTGMDDRCYVAALREALEIDEIDGDWVAYRHSTDRGIVSELCERRFGRAIEADALERFRAAFVGRIGRELAREPGCCTAIDGVERVLTLLLGEHADRCAVSIATGGWEASARMKLAHCGVDLPGVPLVGSDYAMAREAIVAESARRAAEVRGVQRFERCWIVGDGVWDARAAAALGWGFIGIGRGDRAAVLRGHGAAAVLADYTDERGLLGVIERRN